MTTSATDRAIRQAMAASNADLSANGVSSVISNFMVGLQRIGELVPDWWSRRRDIALRDYWKDGAYLGGIMYAAQSKLSNIPFRIEARDPSIVSHVQQAEEAHYRITHISEFGQTWATTIKKFNEDYLGQDNGAFMELIGGGAKDGPISGPVQAVRHIDSSICTRTGDPLFPVRVAEGGREYALYWSRVILASQMPSAKSSMLGVGYCSVSRSTRIAHSLLSMLNYKAEKMGSRPVSQLLVGNNVGGQELLQALIVASSMMDELGLQNFAKTVVIGGNDIDVKRIDFNQMDPFDEETAVTLGIYALAFSWGLEANELIPVIGSKASDQVALQRQRGKLPQVYKTDMELQLSLKMVPPHLKVVLDYLDDSGDQMEAVNQDIRARNRQRNLESGATTEVVERRLMVQRGEVTRDQFVTMMMENHMLEDGSSVATLFFRPGFEQLLPFSEQDLVVEGNDVDQIKVRIQAAEVNLYRLIGSTTSTAQRRRATQALSALDWLRLRYEEANKPEPPPMNGFPPQQEEPEEEQEAPELEEPEDESNDESE